MVHTGTKSTRRNGEGFGEKNQWTNVIQRDDVDYNGDTGETFKKVEEDTNREKRERRNNGSPLDGQEGEKTNRIKTGEKQNLEKSKKEECTPKRIKTTEEKI